MESDSELKRKLEMTIGGAIVEFENATGRRVAGITLSVKSCDIYGVKTRFIGIDIDAPTDLERMNG